MSALPIVCWLREQQQVRKGEFLPSWSRTGPHRLRAIAARPSMWLYRTPPCPGKSKGGLSAVWQSRLANACRSQPALSTSSIQRVTASSTAGKIIVSHLICCWSWQSTLSHRAGGTKLPWKNLSKAHLLATPRPFSVGLLSSCLSPSPYKYPRLPHPRCRSQHLLFLYVIQLVISQILLKSLCKASLLSWKSTVPPNLVSSRSLLSIPSSPESKILMNRTLI